MIPAVGSSSLTLGNRGAESEGTIAELNSQVQRLRQKLSQSGQTETPPGSGAQTVTLSREIVGIQAQIERAVLEAQLTKLNTSPAPAPAPAQAAAPAATDQTSSSGTGSRSAPGQPAAAKRGADTGVTGADANQRATTGGQAHAPASTYPASPKSAAAAAYYKGAGPQAKRLDLQA